MLSVRGCVYFKTEQGVGKISHIRFNGFFSGIRFKMLLSFLLIIGVSFLIIVGSLSSMAGDFLFEARMQSDREALERLADEAAPLFFNADMEQFNRVLTDGADALNGQILLIDAAAKVQADTQGTHNGQLFLTTEVENILVRGLNVDYGVHDVNTGSKINTGAFFFSFNHPSAYMSYLASRVVYGDELCGALVLVSSVSDMMQGLYAMQQQMLIIFLIVAAAALACGLILSQVLTRPISAMTRSIQRMAKGNFSARVKVTSSGELRHMSEAFNTMSEKLETLDFSRNQFVSNASHELKTPLATMKILLESLIYQPDMDKQLRTEFLMDINKEIDRLSAIVSDLLTLVQMDSNSIKLKRENLSLAALVKETAHRLTPMAEKRGQTVQLSLSDPCDTYADRGKLTQVIYNLMENAVKYTQAGGQIKVTLRREGRDAIFTVQDNGMGIPKEGISHIFDRFYRVDKARSRETGGTGLGLSIVHQLVLLHGGSIKVESEEGIGSTFIVELPLHEG